VTGKRTGPVTIDATASGLTAAATSFNVLPGAADHMVFTAAPDVISGSAVDLTVELRDANDNLATSSPVSVAFGQTAGAGSVAGLGSSAATAGAATRHVTGVTAGPVTIQATAGGLAPVSATLSVFAGPADHLSFTSPTSALPSGTQRRLVAEVRDANNNRVDSSLATISFAKTAGSGSVTGVPVSAMALAGVAGVDVTGLAGGPITISAAASGLTTGTTQFTIAPGPVRRTIALKQAGRRLSGKVRSKSPVCTTKVQLRLQIRPRAAKRWRMYKRVTTTRKGTFKVKIRRAASYRAVVVLRPGCAAAHSKRLTVRSLRG
jgi:hypothetical protein